MRAELERWQHDARAELLQVSQAGLTNKNAVDFFQHLGDLLRAGGSPGADLWSGVQRLGIDPTTAAISRVRYVAEELRSELTSLKLIDTTVEVLKRILMTRDRLESVRGGLRRWSIEHGLALLTELAEIDGLLTALDENLAPLRSLATDPVILLGSRAPLVLADPPPPLYVRWEGAGPESPEVPDEMLVPALDYLPAAIIAAFLGNGQFAATVRHSVTSSKQVANEVRDLLATARELGLSRSLAARIVERELLAKASEPIALEVPPATAAAATDVLPEAELRLGRIPGHDAVVSVVSELTGPVVVVHVGADAVTQVEFGSIAVPRRKGKTWEVALPMWPTATESVRLRIEFKEGSGFEVFLSLDRR